MTRRLIMAAAVLVCAGARADEWSQMIGQADQVTQGLVAYYSMRNSGTTVFDEWGGNNGTAVFSPAFAYDNGVVGNGILMNGSSQYIDLGTNLYESYQAGTIAAWIYPTNMTDRLSIISSSVESVNTNWVQFGVYEATKGILIHDRTKNNNNFVLGSTVLASNAWSHVVVTTDGTAYALWVNGAAQSITALVGTNSGAWFGDLGAGAHEVNIGKRQRLDDTYWFAGRIDEVRIYNRALTADEINKLYRMGATPRRIKE
jgi:hypothetical protein